jgi:hypothetical protein
MLTAEFVRRCVLACANQGLAYLAIHNHPGENRVAFSDDDMASHRRGYPALLDILDGPPAGALVFARRAIAGDIWLTAHHQVELSHAVVVGRSQQMLYSSPHKPPDAPPEFDRQVRLLGKKGQAILAAQKVGVVGVGGAGSLINEYLARLGIGRLLVIDFDSLDDTNYPRLVGTRRTDLEQETPPLKVDIAERAAREANPNIRFEAIPGDVVDPDVAERLLDCDAIFLAADKMQARLVVNAICHQYLIPTWQVGAKVQINKAGDIEDTFSVVRQLTPGKTCLWCNQLINPVGLAEEAASAGQRAAQRYVEEIIAPSVITLNAVATAHAVNDYLFSALDLKHTEQQVEWVKYRPLTPQATIEKPRQDTKCSECYQGLGAGPLKPLPVRSRMKQP